ncbi:MAG: IS1634 family transposase [Acidimicrobiales bacterium]
MTASPQGPFRLEAEMLGALPVIDHFLCRLGLARLLDEYVPSGDGRVRLTPTKSIGVVVRNLTISHQPLYSMNEWAIQFDPAALGLEANEVRLVNDDRIGRALEYLFDTDRSSLLARLVLGAVDSFGVDCSEMHNDSTSVRLTGAYPLATGARRGDKATVVVARGHSKDFRPDLKQLVWILTVSADGAVPVACRVASGNVEDSTTHIATWDGLCSLLGRSDFRYVADSKLATRTNMEHIDRGHGRFVTVLPATRKEDGAFRRHLVDHDVTWTEVLRRPARRLGDPDDIYSSTEAPWPSAEGFRVIWVRSSHKVERDANSRSDRVAAGIAALDQLNQKLASNRCRLKTAVAVAEAANEAVASIGAARWVGFRVEEYQEVRHRQETRGRPGANTRYRQITRTKHRIHFDVHEDVIWADARSDGCWPLVTNEKDTDPADILAAYKHQPSLERRHHQLKNDQLVAPMFLHDPARIEGLMTCHFVALLVHALVELEIRRTMAARGLKKIPLYPEHRDCSSPSAVRIFEIFGGLSRRHLIDTTGHVVQTFPPELTKLQAILLDLLGVPEDRYR